jgi:hypothetical protein
MSEEQNYPPEMKKFLDEFITLASTEKSFKKGNNNMMQSALFYEKFRTAVENQEDHLIFKNAVSRIARRKIALSFGVTADSLFDDLMTELAWADYVNLEMLSDEDIVKIKHIIARYLSLLTHVKTKMPLYDVQKIILGWMASEIDEIFFCRKRQELLVDFTYNSLKDNLTFSTEDLFCRSEIQLKLAILTLIFKPDYSYAQYWTARKVFPEFTNFSLEKSKEIGHHFDNVLSQIDKYIKNPYNKNYISYLKKYIAPFLLIKELPNFHSDLSAIKDNRETLKNWLMDVYDKLVMKTNAKVLRGTVRSIIFIFITKISLAFLVEMPYDQFSHGSIVYLPLAINVLLPPVLMLFAGFSVQKPALKNRDMIYKAIDNLTIYQKIDSKIYNIGPRRRTILEKIFNFFFTIFNIAVIAGVVFLLIKIGFNVISVTLFFTFVSAVSFFAFRIRNIALELVMQLSKDNIVVSVIELVFMPFVLIGKLLSATLTKANPFTITLDLLIEAPLKSILKITNSWLRFISQKKEDIDI